MFEAERQAYLKALGIVQYFPRQPIPGALASPELSQQDIYPPAMSSAPEESAVPAEHDTLAASPTVEEVARPPQTERQPQEDSQRAPATEVKRPVADNFSSEGLKVNIPAELLADNASVANLAPKPQAKIAPEVEFCFALVQSPRGIAMLLELEDAGVRDMSAAEHRLLRDLLLALQIPDEGCRFHYFKWPLVNNPRIKQGWPEARETLTAYLQEKLHDSGAAMLLVFGEQPHKALDIQDDRLALGSEMLVTAKSPALHQMLADWRHKARAWRILAPLRGRSV